MDTSLHCNTLACRAVVQDRAVVTTCCHIFCLRCAEKLELATKQNESRKCPACAAALKNPDDAVVAQLNPSEDYKTSVLSGLSPSTIMECAGRGLHFWNYQMTQEILYQQYLARSLTDRYKSLSSHLDKTITEANDEIKRLQHKLESVHDDYRRLDDKYRQLQSNHQERGKSLLQVQNLYRKLKQQQLNAGLELAAEHQATEYISHSTPQRPANAHGMFPPVHGRASGGDGRQRRPDLISASFSASNTRLRNTNPNPNLTPSLNLNPTRIPLPQLQPRQYPNLAQQGSIADEDRTLFNVIHKASPSVRAPHSLGLPNNPVSILQSHGLGAGIKIGSPQLIKPSYGQHGNLSRRPSVGGGSIFT